MRSIANIRSHANRVRALAAAHPGLKPDELVKKSGVGRGEVRAALTRKSTRRKKSSV